MSGPRVTVCVPVFNTASNTKPCIETVFAQEFKGWILFVSDNCSTAGLWQVFQQFHHLQQRLWRELECFVFESSVGGVFTAGNDAVHAQHFHHA